MKSIKLVLMTAIFLFTNLAYSADPVTSKVTFAGINTSGQLFIQLEVNATVAGCSGSQLLLPANSPIKDQVLSLALTAQTTGKDLTVLPSGCVNSKPSISSEGGYGYIYVR